MSWERRGEEWEGWTAAERTAWVARAPVPGSSSEDDLMPPAALGAAASSSAELPAALQGAAAYEPLAAQEAAAAQEGADDEKLDEVAEELESLRVSGQDPARAA